MSRKSKSFFNLTMNDDVEDLEDNLLKRNSISLQKQMKQMEEIYLENKVLDEMIKDQQEKRKAAKQNVYAAKRRIVNIQHLGRNIGKQTNLMITESEKIKDALRLNRILMMEKLVRLERETEDLRRKKQLCSRIRTEKIIIDERKKLKASQKLQRVRLQSLNNTLNLKNELNQLRCNTTQMKRRQVEEVKQTHERQRLRSRKIQNYKKQRARKNYMLKVQQLQQQINTKQKQLTKFVVEEKKQEIIVDSTRKVAEDYLQSFFPTQDCTL